jgi:cellulose synthase/poly-beta-1,6-N-acetylglucosamine synthase-like glycosyltransferase
MSSDIVYAVTAALSSVATVKAVVLSDCIDTLPGVEVIAVPPGTKLSKIRRFARFFDADLICICDPDMRVDAESCRLVFGRAATELCRGNEVVAFGIVDGRDTGSLLSRVVAMDKWLSHRVVRRVLWGLGVGITLPGQFLVVSAGLLRRLDHDVDSYLDDLYLGWIARSQGVNVHRLPVVVGEEDARATWSGLLAQRLRWMKGLARLFRHLAGHPSGIFLLTVHFLAYHGLPILLLSSLVSLSVVSPLLALTTLSAMIVLLARCSGRSYRTTATFLVAFPIVHCLATLLWWVPASRSYLARR